jgi:hypothetical protein
MAILYVELRFTDDAFAVLRRELGAVRRSLDAGLGIGGANPLTLWAEEKGLVAALGEGDIDADGLAEAVAGAFQVVPPDEWRGSDLGDPPDRLLMLPSAERSYRIAHEVLAVMALEGDSRRCICGGCPPQHIPPCNFQTGQDERGLSLFGDSGGLQPPSITTEELQDWRTRTATRQAQPERVKA